MEFKNLMLVVILLIITPNFLTAEAAKKTGFSDGSKQILPQLKNDRPLIDKFEKSKAPTFPEQDECGEKFILLVKGKKIKTSLATFPNCYSLFISTNGTHPVLANVFGKLIRSGPVANQKKLTTNLQLTNSDIIKLVKAVSEELVTHFIRTTPCSFDLSPKGIKRLKRRKVPEFVIQEMQDKMKTEKPNTGGLY